MKKIDGNDNYTIEGSNSQIGDNALSIFNIFIMNYEEIKEKIKKEQKNLNDFFVNTTDIKESMKKLEHFFDIGLLKTPFLDAMFFYFGFGLFFYLSFLLQLDSYRFVGFGIVYFIAAYSLHSWLGYKFVPMIYIMEDKFSVAYLHSKTEYLYSSIRLTDTKVNNNFIDIRFADGSTPRQFNFKDDKAGLLKHKIEEYHRFYNEKR